MAHDFGYNRLGEQFKTCFVCRDKQKKKREDSKKGITHEHWDEVDRELRYKYEEEFKIKSQDKTMSFLQKKSRYVDMRKCYSFGI